MFVRSTGSSRTVKPGINTCTGGGSLTVSSCEAGSCAGSGGSTSLNERTFAVRYLLTLASSSGVECAVVDEYFGDIDAAEAGDMLWARAVVVVPCADRDFIEADRSGFARALAFGLSVDHEAHSFLVGVGRNNERMQTGEWRFVLQQVLRAAEAAAFDVER